MHSNASPQNKTLWSRAKAARHGYATWLTARTQSLLFVYMKHRGGTLSSSAQRCDRSATDSRTAPHSATRPPPRHTPARETHVYTADIVPADNANRTTYWAESMASGGIQRQSIVNWIQGQRLLWIFYLLFCFPDTWRLKNQLLEHLPHRSLPARSSSLLFHLTLVVWRRFCGIKQFLPHVTADWLLHLIRVHKYRVPFLAMTPATLRGLSSFPWVISDKYWYNSVRIEHNPSLHTPSFTQTPPAVWTLRNSGGVVK